MTSIPKILICHILFCLVPGTSFAADNTVRSQEFYQPPAGMNDVELSTVANELTLSVLISGANVNVDIKNLVEGVTLERSFTNRLSAGLNVNYGSESQNNTSSSPNNNNSTSLSGLGDPQIYTKYLIPLDDASFFTSLTFDYSPGANVQPDNNAPGANRYSGGGFLTPKIGIQGRASQISLIGLQISYQYFFPADEVFKNSDGSSSKPDLIVSGGNLLLFGVFYEASLSKFVIDASVDLGSKDSQSTNATSNNYPPSIGNSSILYYGVTGTWLLNSRWNIQGHLGGYASSPAQLSTFTQSFNSGPINYTEYIVGVRYIF